MRALHRVCRQLQDAGNLTGQEPGQKHDLAGRELERIVMRMGLAWVHPPELSNFSDDSLAFAKEVEWGLILHVFLECEFCPWRQANRNSRLPDSGKPAGDRVAKVRGYQPVADLCGSRGDRMQTVVTHRSGSIYCERTSSRPICHGISGDMTVCQSRVGEDPQADFPGSLRLGYARSVLVATSIGPALKRIRRGMSRTPTRRGPLNSPHGSWPRQRADMHQATPRPRVHSGCTQRYSR